MHTAIDEPVHLVSYNALWKQWFLDEKNYLLSFLDSRVIEIEHIGSTSIPGLTAKPIVDIMIGIDTYPPSDTLLAQLSAAQYTVHGEAGVPGRIYLVKRGEKNFNLAVVAFKMELWLKNLSFRDHLRKHPDVCRQYEEIKQQALESGANRLLSYSDFKRDFIQEVYKTIAEK